MADNKATKSAGEHWVCSVLARQGWGAALTRDGLERTDILAVDPTAEPRHTIEAQVKTCTDVRDRSGTWPLKAVPFALSDDEWYVFVELDPKTTDQPRSFIVPRDHAAAAIHISHIHWATDPTATRSRNPKNLPRLAVPVLHGYEDRWDLLRGPASAAPVLLPPEYHEYALSERVGVPEGHPWRDSLPEW
jgi:hypothetical protein